MKVMESVNVGEIVGYQDAKDTLRRWREDNVRKSSQTIHLGQLLLSKWPSRLGSEGEH